MAKKPIQQRGNGFKDLTGESFGRLTVIRYDQTAGKKARWLCLCSCGSHKSVDGYNLRSGVTRSCGCLQRQVTSSRSRTHNARGNPKTAAVYQAWSHMIQRCTNPNNKAWSNYGARGITVCPEWRYDFAAFYRHVGPKPSSKHSIDRIDNDGNYEPGNVRWATRQQQSLNRRKYTHTKKKTHCPQGHEYTEDNIYWLPNGARRCLICKRAHGRATARRMKAKANGGCI